MCALFPFGFEGEVLDLIVLIPAHCLVLLYERPNLALASIVIYVRFVSVRVEECLLIMKHNSYKAYKTRIKTKKRLIQDSQKFLSIRFYILH